MYSDNTNNDIRIIPFFKTRANGKNINIYIVDIPGRASLYYAESLSKAKDYAKGYRKEYIKIKTTSYKIGLKDRLRDDMLFGNIIA